MYVRMHVPTYACGCVWVCGCVRVRHDKVQSYFRAFDSNLSLSWINNIEMVIIRPSPNACVLRCLNRHAKTSREGKGEHDTNPGLAAPGSNDPVVDDVLKRGSDSSRDQGNGKSDGGKKTHCKDDG